MYKDEYIVNELYLLCNKYKNTQKSTQSYSLSNNMDWKLNIENTTIIINGLLFPCLKIKKGTLVYSGNSIDFHLKNLQGKSILWVATLPTAIYYVLHPVSGNTEKFYMVTQYVLTKDIYMLNLKDIRCHGNLLKLANKPHLTTQEITDFLQNNMWITSENNGIVMRESEVDYDGPIANWICSLSSKINGWSWLGPNSKDDVRTDGLGHDELLICNKGSIIKDTEIRSIILIDLLVTMNKNSILSVKLLGNEKPDDFSLFNKRITSIILKIINHLIYNHDMRELFDKSKLINKYSDMIQKLDDGLYYKISSADIRNFFKDAMNIIDQYNRIEYDTVYCYVSTLMTEDNIKYIYELSQESNEIIFPNFFLKL